MGKISTSQNYLLTPIFAAIAFAQIPLHAQTQELYFNSRTDNDSTYINNPVNWYTAPQKQPLMRGLSTAIKTEIS